MGKNGLKIVIIAWTHSWIKQMKHWNCVSQGKLPNETGFIGICINYESQEREKKIFPSVQQHCKVTNPQPRET